MAAKRFYDRGQFLQSTQLTECQSLQLVRTECLFSANPMIFYLVPYLLNGIKLWRVRCPVSSLKTVVSSYSNDADLA